MASQDFIFDALDNGETDKYNYYIGCVIYGKRAANTRSYISEAISNKKGAEAIKKVAKNIRAKNNRFSEVVVYGGCKVAELLKPFSDENVSFLVIAMPKKTYTPSGVVLYVGSPARQEHLLKNVEAFANSIK